MRFNRPQVAISSCLLGQNVRYDGDHSLHDWLSRGLSTIVDLLPICPEVSIGLGVPRPPIQLVGSLQKYRAVGVEDSSLDVTIALTDFGKDIAISHAHISAYVFKSKSPSCGVRNVKLFDNAGRFRRKAIGLHAATLISALPNLPICEEISLDAVLTREQFIIRLFVYHRWKTLSLVSWQQFHEEHTVLFSLYSKAACKRMTKCMVLEDSDAYEREFTQAMRRSLRAKDALAACRLIFNKLYPEVLDACK